MPSRSGGIAAQISPPRLRNFAFQANLECGGLFTLNCEGPPLLRLQTPRQTLFHLSPVVPAPSGTTEISTLDGYSFDR